MLKRLLKDEAGQDLVEYSLLLALVVVMSAALIYNSHTEMATVASRTASTLSRAAGGPGY